MYILFLVREKENVYFQRKRIMPILLPNLCYIVLQNKPAPIRSEKKHNIIPIILLTNTTNRRLQGHSAYVIRNIKFSDNVRHKKN